MSSSNSTNLDMQNSGIFILKSVRIDANMAGLQAIVFGTSGYEFTIFYEIAPDATGKALCCQP